MILKKPYAFLIKNFRLIHLILTFIMIYLVLKEREIYKYITNVIKDLSLKYNALSYINYKIYIYIGILLILFLIVYLLLKYKDKPRKIYVISILGYIIISIFMFTVFSYFTGIVNNSIDQKIIRLYRDIFTISLYFQYFLIILMGIRGLGFDIKKFDFNKDAALLNITNEDDEEVIVDVNINTTGAMRYIRKQKRELGYFYKEYKAYIIIILLIIITIISFKGYNVYKEKYKIYLEKTTVGNYNKINVVNSYYDLENNVVIVEFSIFKSGIKEKLNLGNMILLQGDNKYYSNKNICNNYNVVSKCYKQQYITNVSKNYIITYSVDNININKSYLIYKENDKSNYKIKLNMKNYN